MEPVTVSADGGDRPAAPSGLSASQRRAELRRRKLLMNSEQRINRIMGFHRPGSGAGESLGFPSPARPWESPRCSAPASPQTFEPQMHSGSTVSPPPGDEPVILSLDPGTLLPYCFLLSGILALSLSPVSSCQRRPPPSLPSPFPRTAHRSAPHMLHALFSQFLPCRRPLAL